MSVPGIVESRLDEEDVATQVALSGGDEVFVTPTRTLVYRGEGLLSDESVEEFGHDADRLLVSEGRRKSTITYQYAVEDDRELTVPTNRLDGVLQPVLAGVLRARGVTDDDERIVQAHRFSELTLVITSERLLKHVGSAVWDQEYESYHFEDVESLEYEEGSVATRVVVAVDGRTQRIKTPNDEFPAVRERLESAVLSYRNLSSIEELSPADEDEDEADDEAATDAVASLGSEGIDPLSTGDTVDIESDAVDLEEDPLADPTSTEETEESESEETGESESGEAGESESGEAGESESGEGVDEGDGTTDQADSTGGDADRAGTDSDAPPADGDDLEQKADEEQAAQSSSDDAPAETDDADEGVIEEWESPPDESEGSFGDEFESATESDEAAIAEEIAELSGLVERQNELLARQRQTIQQLVEALREREASREDTE